MCVSVCVCLCEYCVPVVWDHTGGDHSVRMCLDSKDEEITLLGGAHFKQYSQNRPAE